MDRRRRLWYVLVGVEAVAWLFVGLAVYLDWHLPRLTMAVLPAYFLVVSVVRLRFLRARRVPGSAEDIEARAKWYPSWW